MVAHLNGSHGEYTNSDDVRLSGAQLAFLSSIGHTYAGLHPLGQGLAVYDSDWGGTFYFYEAGTAMDSQPLKGTIRYWYDSSGTTHTGGTTVESLPISISPKSQWSMTSESLGVTFATCICHIDGLPYSACFSMSVHQADFYNAVALQTGFLVAAGQSSQSEVAFLNGNNGEWTNTDDVKGRTTRRRPKAYQTSKKKNQGKIPIPRPRIKVKRQPQAALSHCAQKYARAIADPFSPVAIGACVPVYPSPPSYKVTAHTRAFTVTVGTSGVGGAWFMPTIYNNNVAIMGTTSSFSGTDLTLPSTDPGTSVFSRGGFPTLPFASTDSIQGRVISMAVRVTYTGTALDLSGMFVSFVEPDHEPVPSPVTVDSMAVLPYARVENTKRRMQNLSPVFGVKPAETQFLTEGWPIGMNHDGSAGTQTVDYDVFRHYGYAGFVVSGVPETTFNVELIQHVEYIGRAAASGLSLSHSDSKGFEMVQQAGGQLASYLASSAKAAWPAMRELLGEAARDLAVAAIPTARRALMLM